MKKTFMLPMLIILCGLGFALNASAQDWTCSDLTWSAERLANTPNIVSNCLDVVEINGLPYAQLRARVERQATNSTFVSYQGPDGKWSASERVFPGGFTASIGGQDVKITDLPARQEVNVYVKSEGNFSYPAAAPVAAVAPATAPVSAPAPEPEPMPVSLPTTATQMSLFALLGGIFILMSGMIAVARTRL